MLDVGREMAVTDMDEWQVYFAASKTRAHRKDKENRRIIPALSHAIHCKSVTKSRQPQMRHELIGDKQLN
jgi:hypothetical protein